MGARPTSLLALGVLLLSTLVRAAEPDAAAGEAEKPPPAKTALLDRLCEQAMLYVRLPSVDADRPATALERALRSEPMQAFLKPLFGKLETIDALVAMQVDASPLSIWRERTEALEVAILVPDTGGLRLVARLPVGEIEDPEGVIGAVERFLGGGNEGRIDRTEAGATEIRSATVRGRRLSWVRQEAGVFLGWGTDVLEPLFAGDATAAAGSFRAGFAELFDAIDVSQDGALACGDVAALLRAFDKRGAVATRRVRFVYNSRAVGEGYRDRFAVETGPGLPLSDQPVDVGPTRFAPARTDLFVCANVRPKALWAHLRQVIGQVPQAAADEARIRLEERVRGVPVGDFLDTLGAGVSLQAGSEGLALVWAVKEPEALARHFQTMAAHDPAAIRQTLCGGQTLYAWPGAVEGLSAAPAWALVEKRWLVVALWPHVAKSVIARILQGDAPTLAEDDAFRRVTAEIPAGTAFGYCELGGRIREAWERGAAAAHAVPRPPGFPLNPSRIPPIALYEDDFFDLAVGLEARDGVLVGTAYSPFGGGGAAVAVAAELLPRLLRDRVSQWRH
jgi:hypothetical protein